jgi:ankyrin repeat protein
MRLKRAREDDEGDVNPRPPRRDFEARAVRQSHMLKVMLMDEDAFDTERHTELCRHMWEEYRKVMRSTGYEDLFNLDEDVLRYVGDIALLRVKQHLEDASDLYRYPDAIACVLDAAPHHWNIKAGNVSDWFRSACEEDVPETVALLLDSDTKLHVRDIPWILRDVCEKGHVEVLRLCLNSRRKCLVDSVRAWRNELFSTACSHGHAEMVRMLLDTERQSILKVCADGRRSTFVKVCLGGHADVLALLLDPDRNFNIHVKAKRSEKFDALYGACLNGRIEVIKLLLDPAHKMNFDVDAIDHALMMACNRDSPEMLEVLLDSKLHIDIHRNDEAAFHTACQNGKTEVVKTLLDPARQLNIDVHADYEDGFRRACREGHLDVVKVLLDPERQLNIDVHALDEDGFIYACSRGHVEIVKLLLDPERKLNIDVNAQGSEAFRLARNRNQLEVMKVLLDPARGLNVDTFNRGDRDMQMLIHRYRLSQSAAQ